MQAGTAAWIGLAAGGGILAVAVGMAWRSLAGSARRTRRADRVVRHACLSAIAFAQDFRLHVQEAARGRQGASRPPRFPRRMEDLSAEAGPFPGREDIVRTLREINGEADRMAGEVASLPESSPMGILEGWAGDREMWIRHYSRNACRGRKGPWRDPPVVPAPVAAA